MNALLVMDRYQKKVIQVSTYKNDVKVQYLYNNLMVMPELDYHSNLYINKFQKKTNFI